MTPATAMQLQDRLGREISGLNKMAEQLADPEAGLTPGGLKSGLLILARALIRANRIALEITRAEVEPPSPRNPFDHLFR